MPQRNVVNAENKITVGHWPFSNQFHYLTNQINFGWMHLLYICSGVIKCKVMFPLNDLPNLNAYFVLCVNS